MPDDVTLQFTQQDRDMLRDTNRDVKELLDNSKALTGRVTKLEMWRNLVIGFCTASGFIAGVLVKAVWR